MEPKAHWEKVYKTKSDKEVSWFEDLPKTSLHLINELDIDLSDSIIDVGGGNSNLISELYKKGFRDLTVLDISGNSIEKTQKKMGDGAKNIHWIESDILEFAPEKKYTLWHDRATFHFLTDPEDKLKYKSRLIHALKENGYFVLSTFSYEGPKKCSGLDICQYDTKLLTQIFDDTFELKKIFNENHKTPFNTTQNFIFSIWKVRSN